MAITIIGLNSSSIRPQPGFSVQQSETGGWIGTHTVIVTRDGFDNEAIRSKFANGQLLTGIDPDIPALFNFLRVTEVTVAANEGDLITLQVTASGSSSAQYGFDEDEELGTNALPKYFLAGELRDRPFSEHRKWKALTPQSKTLLGLLLNGGLEYVPEYKEIGGALGNKNINGLFWTPSSLQFPEEDVNALKFAALIAEGQTTYESAAYTWTESTEGTSSLTSGQLNNLSKISNPRGEPPTASGERDWRLTSVSQDQQGLLYRTTLTWTLSDEGGHNSFLYD
jgi:hypothetical protein